MRPRQLALEPADGSTTRAKLAASLIQTKRVATGSIAGNGTLALTVTWDTAFSDASYTLIATVLDAADDLVLESIRSVVAGSAVVFIRNKDSINASSGTVNAIAIHD